MGHQRGADPDARSRGSLKALMLAARAVRPHRGLMAAFIVAAITQGVLQGLLVWALREILQRFSPPHVVTAGFLAVAGGVIFALWILRALFTSVGELVSVRLAQRAELDSMQRVVDKLLTMPVRFIERSSQGDLVMAAYQDHHALRTIVLHLGTVLLNASRLLALGVVAYLMSPMLAFIGLLSVPVGLLPAHHLGRRITRAAREERRSTATMHDVFLQLAAGFRIIKVNRAEARVLEQARTTGREMYRFIVRQAQSATISRFLLEAVSGVGLIAVIIVGGREVAAGVLSWQSLLSLLIAVMAVYSPLVNLVSVYSSVRSFLPSLDRLDRILDAPAELPDAPDARPLPGPPSIIELQDVWFGYGDQPVLKGLTASFTRGETIGIVGPSGAGKSTLIALLLRLYDPTRGRILLDGVDLRDIRHADLMDRCAIVLQEPFLFVDTIANNIRISRPTASMAEVASAAKAANIHEEIEATHEGYETLIGRHERGRGISGGQKQRIAIAAALLKNAPILFLDEATSNLDSLSERAVQSAVEHLLEGRTSFVIAHRLSTLRSVDRILVLDRGEVVGLGTHKELLATCHTYQRLWHTQVGYIDPGVDTAPVLRVVT